MNVTFSNNNVSMCAKPQKRFAAKDIESMVEQGKSLSEIAAYYKVCNDRMSSIIKYMGIMTPQQKAWQELDKTCYELIQQGYSQREIAEKMGITTKVVRTSIRRLKSAKKFDTSGERPSYRIRSEIKTAKAVELYEKTRDIDAVAKEMNLSTDTAKRYLRKANFYKNDRMFKADLIGDGISHGIPISRMAKDLQINLGTAISYLKNKFKVKNSMEAKYKIRAQIVSEMLEQGKSKEDIAQRLNVSKSTVDRLIKNHMQS